MQEMSVISGHLIFTDFLKVTGCQRDPRDRGVTNETPRESVIGFLQVNFDMHVVFPRTVS